MSDSPKDIPSVSYQQEVGTVVLDVASSLHEAVEDTCRNAGKEFARKALEAATEFSELNPGIHFHEIRYVHAKEHLRSLMRLPNRRTLRKPYRSLPLSEVVLMDIPEGLRMSNKTINQRMDRLASLWDWAEEHEACSGRNPFRRRSLTLSEVPIERGRFSSDDLNTLLQSPLYVDQGYRSGVGASRSWWWLIPMAMFTGARVGELAQLTLDDVRTVDGVLCLSINDDGEKSVKTAAGKRLCPVHPQLLALGFTEYVAELRQRGCIHILPHPNAGRTPAAKTCSKWFNGRYRVRHLPECWVAEHKVFHSFRHTFISRALNELDLDMRRVQFMVGHEPVWMGETRRYARGAYRVADLQKIMESFHYEGVDLGHLAGGWQGLRLD